MSRFSSTALVLTALSVPLIAGIVTPVQATTADQSRTAGRNATTKLHAVSASSASDAWAVGFRHAPGGSTQALTRHWDGTAWATVPSAQPGDNNFLWGVVSLSPDDAWAVGEWIGGASIQPFAEHWDGTAWEVVPLHQPIGLGKLNAVSASGPDDVWMVGTNYPGPQQTARTFIEHWDGKRIERVRSGRLAHARSSELTGISAVTPQDVWAVGGHGLHGQTDLPLLEHFDGTSWSVVSHDLERGMSANVAAVDGRADDDAWSVGWEAPDGQPSTSALAEHWDGTSWSQSPALTPGYSSSLWGVSIVASDDVWAVGSWVKNEADQRSFPLIEHWDGAVWSVVDAPVRRQSTTYVESVSMGSPSAGWVVGETTSSGHTSSYSIRWDGDVWRR